MSYQVLARKWRPRNFEQLVGQEHVVRPLINALANDRLHHAFLFTGTRGVGKTTIARILAKSLNCETGVSATPCGQCTACNEVDEGRFIDLIEVDAASRTKVDDTRELLDNVAYAPTRGRYKVYLIDEVHMLSGHSFNALLKTLEEPPPHVKFLLATTDPQKLPVTVLSRCLQFHLKRLQPEQIRAQLVKILSTEGVGHDTGAVELIARAADGSMRDGLSLLDQAIAYGGGKLAEAEVRAMLGTIERAELERILSALSSGDGAALMAAAAEVVERGALLEPLLEELLTALYRIALIQTDPKLAAQAEQEFLGRYAEALAPEDVQLFYQIGVMGRRDLPYAPDPRTGVEMTLLRMLAFRPETGAATDAAPKAKTQATASAPAGRETIDRAGDWGEIVARLKITGLIRELANHMTLAQRSGDDWVLTLDASKAQLLSKERERELSAALESALGRRLHLKIELGEAGADTPALQRRREQDERAQRAIEVIENDPNVRALQQEFGARITPNSIRSKA